MGDLLRQVVSSSDPLQSGGGVFFKLIASAAPVDIVFHRQGSTKRATQVEAGYQYGPLPEDLRFHKVTLTSASTQTVALLVGEEYEDYERIVGVVQVQQATSLTTTSDKLVSTGAAQLILAANTSRQRAVIKSADANDDDIRIGDSSVSTSRGVRLSAGQVFTSNGTSAIYATAHGGNQIVELLEEMG